MKAICVFCGSSNGNDGRYKEAAKALGTFLARSGITLIYGGGTRGLMGEVAEAALRHQGRVVGIIPLKVLEKHTGGTRLDSPFAIYGLR
ncbi:LOG family protein [Geobacillus sp. FSL W8-0466]|uniref:LOG family protein n=1 Tax=Geobacillus TaxID=129337 RepID=UPI0007B1BED7|nr:LOG family protein YvdD [Geobacillus stearothermophilus]